MARNVLGFSTSNCVQQFKSARASSPGYRSAYVLRVPIHVELQEVELELGEDFPDPRQGEAVLLRVEQEVAAATRVVEVLDGRQAPERAPPVDQLQIVPELAIPSVVAP